MSHNDLVRTQEKKVLRGCPTFVYCSWDLGCLPDGVQGRKEGTLESISFAKKKKEKKDSFKAMHTRFSFLWNWKRSRSNIC